MLPDSDIRRSNAIGHCGTNAPIHDIEFNSKRAVTKRRLPGPVFIIE